MLPRSVLSPVDFSEHSRHALRWAGAFAARFQSRLTVISVVDPLLAEAARIRLGKDLAKAETEPALRGFVAATWSEGGARPPDQTVVKTTVGEPATAILAVPSPSSDSDVESQHQGFEISHILAATDFSESSVAAAQAAVELSMRWSAPLTLVHVLAPLKVPAQWQPLVQESEEMRGFGSYGAQNAGRAAVWYASLRRLGGSGPSSGNDWLDRSRPWHATRRHGTRQRARCFRAAPRIHCVSRLVFEHGSGTGRAHLRQMTRRGS